MEGRLEDILKHYWETLPRATVGSIPSESTISPDALKNVWDDCFLVQITPDNSFRYDYLGKDLVDAYGEGYHDGDEADKLIDTHSNRAIRIFSEVVKGRKPVDDEGEFVNSRHLLIKYRQYLFPLGNKERVTHIFGGMRWKAY